MAAFAPLVDDLVRRHADRLQSRRAEPIHRGRRHGLGQPRRQRGDTRDVHAGGSFRQTAPADHVLDLLDRQLRHPRQRALDRGRGHIVGPGGIQATAKGLPQRRTSAGNDNGFTHGIVSFEYGDYGASTRLREPRFYRKARRDARRPGAQGRAGWDEMRRAPARGGRRLHPWCATYPSCARRVRTTTAVCRRLPMPSTQYAPRFTQTVLIWVYSSRAALPISRPKPLCL